MNDKLIVCAECGDSVYESDPSACHCSRKDVTKVLILTMLDAMPHTMPMLTASGTEMPTFSVDMLRVDMTLSDEQLFLRYFKPALCCLRGRVTPAPAAA